MAKINFIIVKHANLWFRHRLANYSVKYNVCNNVLTPSIGTAGNAKSIKYRTRMSDRKTSRITINNTVTIAMIN